MYKFMSWLGPRITAEGRVNDTVWYLPPSGPHRIGDLSKKELRFELFRVHRHIAKGGRSTFNTNDQKIIFFDPNGYHN